MFALIPKTILVVLVCLLVADIAGAVATTIVDVLPFRKMSAGANYAILFVFGVFCGLFAYNIAGAWSAPKGGTGDWSAQPGAGGIGTGVLIIGGLVIAALCALFYTLYWSKGPAGDDYVPDSAPHSIVFLGSTLAAMILGRFMLMPTPNKAA